MKVPARECSWERILLSDKVPGSESSLANSLEGTKVPGSELARVLLADSPGIKKAVNRVRPLLEHNNVLWSAQRCLKKILADCSRTKCRGGSRNGYVVYEICRRQALYRTP